MTTATPSDGQKIRAAELLGKSIGLFKDVTVTDDNRSADELQSDLLARLEALGLTSQDEEQDASGDDAPASGAVH